MSRDPAGERCGRRSNWGQASSISKITETIFYSNHYSKGSQQRGFSRGQTWTVFCKNPQDWVERTGLREEARCMRESNLRTLQLSWQEMLSTGHRGESGVEGFLLVVQCQPSHFSSLDLHFLICKMGIIMPTPLNEMRWHMTSTCPVENSVTTAIVIMMILLALLIRPLSIYVPWNGCMSTLLISLKH